MQLKPFIKQALFPIKRSIIKGVRFVMEKEKDFRKELAIDQYNLSEEWLDQALKYAEWAEEAVDASFEYDKAKEKFELTRAEIEKEIREDPGRFGLIKATEGAITNAILNDPRYQESSSMLLETKRNWKIMEIAREAFEHRKKALEKLTDLYLNKYYAEPYIPKAAKNIAEGETRTALTQDLNTSMGAKTKLSRREG
jgi:hypothetical protein